jgi:hypothetical protein
VAETDADFNEIAPLIQFHRSISLAGLSGKGKISFGKIGSGPPRDYYWQTLVLLEISQDIGAGGRIRKASACPVAPHLKLLNA